MTKEILWEDLEKLQNFFLKRQRFPTYEEMMPLFGLASKSAVAYRINKLIESGDVLKERNNLLLARVSIKF